MQTIKTAAIVVLLMSVVYGAYISLTTPPEPLPDGVLEGLVMDDGSATSIDAALPPSLGEFGISTGTPMGSPVAMDSQPRTDSLGVMENSVANRDANPGPVSMTSPADGAGGQAAAEQGFAATFSDRSPSANSASEIAASGLGTKPTLDRVIDPATGYPTTGRTFSMPDPNSIDESIVEQAGNRPPSADSIAQVSAIDRGNGIESPTATNVGLANAIRTADKQFQNDQRKEALSTLSIFYGTPNLSGEQRSELLSRLDPLAADVIYSQKHLLERPYKVGSGETLMQIADRFAVPWQLLANINRVRDPVAVVPGTELKVVRGPFRAEVSLANKELTLFLGELYAGRFPIEAGNDPQPIPGTFTVQEKQVAKTYYDRSGSPVPAGSPSNPYGEAWIDLGGQLSIHGSPDASRPTDKGCISLAGDYADDLYGILSQGSSVSIVR